MDVDTLTLPHMAHGEADCTAKVLNVREGPSLQAKIIGSLTAGRRVIVWQVEGVWWFVQAAAGLFGLGLQRKPQAGQRVGAGRFAYGRTDRGGRYDFFLWCLI